MDYKLVRLRFYDHYSHDDVEDPESLRPIVCEAVGWLVREDDLYYYISPWMSMDDERKFDVNAVLKRTVIGYECLMNCSK